MSYRPDPTPSQPCPQQWGRGQGQPATGGSNSKAGQLKTVAKLPPAAEQALPPHPCTPAWADIS